MTFILLIIRDFPLTTHRNILARLKPHNIKIPLILQAILFPGKTNLSDNLEQPDLTIHPHPLRRYKACSYEPVLCCLRFAPVSITPEFTPNSSPLALEFITYFSKLAFLSGSNLRLK
jgi:hypothetical protein